MVVEWIPTCLIYLRLSPELLSILYTSHSTIDTKVGWNGFYNPRQRSPTKARFCDMWSVLWATHSSGPPQTCLTIVSRLYQPGMKFLRFSISESRGLEPAIFAFPELALYPLHHQGWYNKVIEIGALYSSNSDFLFLVWNIWEKMEGNKGNVDGWTMVPAYKQVFGAQKKIQNLMCVC